MAVCGRVCRGRRAQSPHVWSEDYLAPVLPVPWRHPRLLKRKLKFTNNQKCLPKNMPRLCFRRRKLNLTVTADGMENLLGLSLVFFKKKNKPDDCLHLHYWHHQLSLVLYSQLDILLEVPECFDWSYLLWGAASFSGDKPVGFQHKRPTTELKWGQRLEKPQHTTWYMAGALNGSPFLLEATGSLGSLYLFIPTFVWGHRS